MGYIAGVVTDAGVAVSGANVRAHRLDDGTLTTTTTTDAAGLFVFSALVTSDAYTIVAHDPAGGTAYNAIVWDNVIALANLTRTLTVPAGLDGAAVGTTVVKNEVDFCTIMMRMTGGSTANEAALVITESAAFTASAPAPNGGDSLAMAGSGSTGQPTAYNYAANAAVEFGTDDFTVELHVMPTFLPAAGELGDVFYIGDDNVYARPAGGIQLSLDEYGVWQVYYFTSVVALATPATTFTWQHIAICREGTALRIFVDGALDTTVTCASALLGDQFLFAPPDGILGDTVQHYVLDCEADELRVLNGYAKYLAAFTPLTTHPAV